MKRRWRSKVSLALAGLLASGCYTTHVRTDPSAALAEPVDAAQVTRTNGSTVAVRRPVVRADSLVGWTASGDSLRVAIPLAEVQSVEVRELSPVLSLHLAGLVAAAVAGAIFLYETTRPGPITW